MTNIKSCILDGKKKGGCASCPFHCPHRIALHGLDGSGGRIGASGMPEEYKHLTLTNSPANEGQEALYESLERYVQSFGEEDVKSVYLWSESPGTGKTTTACALLNEWISRKYVEYWRKGEQVPQVLGVFLDINEMQSEYNLATMSNNDEGLEKVANKIERSKVAPYLVIDDIGVRDATDSFRSLVHSIINHRVVNGMPTVYTSNLPIKSKVPLSERRAANGPYDMEEVFDERLYDRIRSNVGSMEFGGVSNRKHVGR